MHGYNILGKLFRLFILTNLHNWCILHTWWFGVTTDPSANSGILEENHLSEERRETSSLNNLALSQDGLTLASTPLTNGWYVP
jgi:hypothetical protein